MKMKLNKFQYAWIKKLKSGTTKKAKGALKKGSGYCCLGVGICVVGEKFSKYEKIDLDCGFYPETNKALMLHSDEGYIFLKYVSPKWKKEILNAGMDKSNTNEPMLTSLNDYTDWSHAKIGRFIDENREAVFAKAN